MARLLKYFTIGLWILILTYCIAYYWMGISYKVDENVINGIIQPMNDEIQKEILTKRLHCVLWIVPVLMLFGFVMYSIITKRDKLFYSGMILTILPILTLAIIGLFNESEMPYKNLTLIMICIPIVSGLVIGIIELYKRSKKNNI
jgi:hypothetical protein